MPRVAYPNEVGIADPDIIEVRISTTLTRRTGRGPSGKNVPTDHILKVRHRIFGWLTPWEWGMLAKVEKFIDRIDPISTAAWIGFTVAYKGGIDSAQAFADWLTGAAGQATGALADFMMWWASGVSQVFGQGPFQDVPPIEEAISGLTEFSFKALFDLMGRFFFPLGEITEWFWAAIAGAISVLLLKRGISL